MRHIPAKADAARIIALLAMLTAASPLTLACEEHAAGKEPVHRSEPQHAALVAAVVREVDPTQQTITLAHRRIANLHMGAMSSMVFRASDPTVLATLKPGEKVKFRASLVDHQPTVTEIRVAR